MDLQTILAIAFIALILVFILVNRKKVQFQFVLFPVIYFILLRTKLGIAAMEKLAKRFRGFIVGLSTVGIAIGFAAMIYISYELIKSTVALLVRPEAIPSVMPVLPVEAKGIFYVPLFYWLFSIFIIAVVHEFSHGVVSRAFKIPVNSSGIAVLGLVVPLIPAAFVEPDEKKLVKAPVRAQLAVFAAGSFANILLAVVLIFLLGLQVPFIGSAAKSTAVIDIEKVLDDWTQLNGLKIIEVKEGSPADLAMVRTGLTIYSINGVRMSNLSAYSDSVSNVSIGDNITLGTNYKTYKITVAESPTKKGNGYMGLTFEPLTTHNRTLTNIVLTVSMLLIWIIVLNLGVGVFNLLPLGPLDGGRMAQLVMKKFSKKHGYKVWKWLSAFLFILIITNLLAGFV
jgi:membrane-associated protease RseP (regulator of RpoE activity)